MRKVLRVHHWWSGKIPPALAVAYLAMARSLAPLDATQAALRLSLFFVSCLGIGGLGYLLTDAFDVEEDRKNGKENGWAALAKSTRIPVVALLFAAAWLPWLALPNARSASALIALELVLFALYAIPPVRLKERGFAGIVTDALYAHVLPVTVAWVAFSPPSFVGGPLVPLLLAAWMLPMGMRHLARHQHDDLDRDRLAGARTWAVRRGRDAAMRFIAGRVLPLEALLALAALAALVHFAPLLLTGFVVHTLWELHVARVRSLSPLPPFAEMTDTERHDLYGQRILSTFVERWLAPLALVTLILHDRTAVWLVPLHLLFVGSPLRAWWRDVRALPRFAPRSA